MNDLSGKPALAVTVRRFLVPLLAIIVLSSNVGAMPRDVDDPMVGRWNFPMDQVYVFKNDGTFTGEPGLSGKWEFKGGDLTRNYVLHFKNGDEKVTLARGDKEGHEFETGHTLRLGKQMQIKKLADAAD